MTDATAARQMTSPGATRLTVPLIAYSFIGNATGLAVLAMLGRLGDKAIAGAGIGGVIFSLLMALTFGFDTGVQALVSRATGAGARELAGGILTEALVVSVPFGVLLCAICAGVGPRVASLLTQDKAVVAQASAYLSSAAPSLAFLATTVPFNAYWIATGNPRITFFVATMTVPAQILIAWPLILGAMGIRGLGVGGAGLAVTAGTFFGLLVQLALGTRLKRIEGLFRYWSRPGGVAAILAIGWPVSLQQSLVQFGSIISFGIISHLGVAAIAIVNVLGTLALVPTQTAVGIGTACGTLVGQALGCGDAAAAKRWGWRLAGTGAVLLAPLGLFAVVAARTLLGFFLHDPHTLLLAIWPTRLLGLGVGIDAFVWILSFALRGAGATKIATAISFLLRSAMALPLIWLIGVRLHFGISGIATVLFVLAAIEAFVFAVVWSRGRWARTGVSLFPRRDKNEEIAERRYAASEPPTLRMPLSLSLRVRKV